MNDTTNSNQADDDLFEVTRQILAPAARVAMLSACKRNDWDTVINLAKEMLANPKQLARGEKDVNLFQTYLVQAHFEKEEYELCVTECTNALRTKKSFDILVWRMRALRRLGRHPEALVDCDAAIALAQTDNLRRDLQEYRKRLVS